MLQRRVTVRRSGIPIEIDAVDVVVDDLLLLVASDRIPADAQIRTQNVCSSTPYV